MARCTVEIIKYKTGTPNADDYYLMELDSLTDGQQIDIVGKALYEYTPGPNSIGQNPGEVRPHNEAAIAAALNW